MSCYYKENNIEKAAKWRRKAEEYFVFNTENFYCINPMDYYSIDGNYHTNDFEPMRFDLRKVKESRAVLVNLADLNKSIGTCDEIMYAWINNIPIIGFLEEGRLLDNVHPWKCCQIDRIEVGENSQEKAMEYIRNYYG